MRQLKFLALLITLLLLLGACGQAVDSGASASNSIEPSPPASPSQQSPSVTPSPMPIATTPPDVSDTAEPSPSPSPAATPEPTPEPTTDPTEKPKASNAAGTPLSGIVIGLDPGHQSHSNSDQEPVAPGSGETKKKVSSGTQGRFTDVAEYEVNLKVGLKLKKILTDLGATVVMSRESHDVDISNSERAIMMNEADAALVVRLHCNGSDNSDKHGAVVLIPSNDCTAAINDASKKAGKCIVKAFADATGAKDLGLQPRSDQTGFNWSTVPVCNVEMGYMTNEKEDNLLVKDDYQDQCAHGIANGIVDYFS